MLLKDIYVEPQPQAYLQHTVAEALNLLHRNDVAHLPVLENEQFTGIISREALQKEDAPTRLQELTHLLQPYSVPQSEHLLSALSMAASHDLSLVPVTDAGGRLIGSVSTARFPALMAKFLRLQEPGALIVLEMAAWQFSLADINRILESNDAQITQLITTQYPEKENLLVTLRTNKQEISGIVAAFQRYDYIVKYYTGEELFANELKSNYENLMNYLNI